MINTEKIEELINELERLEYKYKNKGKLNFFDAAGLNRQEIKYSKVLSFLLDPSKPHGLSDRLFKELIKINQKSIINNEFSKKLTATRLLLESASDLLVFTEWRRIDILCVSKDLNLLVAIENKIDAKESKNNGVSQLKVYENAIEQDEEYKNYHKLFLFLSPEGDEASEEKWTSINYQDIISALETSLHKSKEKNEISNEGLIFVRQYIDFIGTNIVSNPELQEDCRTIYGKYKDILELIYDNRPDDSGFSELIDSNFRDDCKKIGAKGGLFGYLPVDIFNLLHKHQNIMPKKWWGFPLIFEYGKRDEIIRLSVVVGPWNNKTKRRNFIEKLRETTKITSKRPITDEFTTILCFKTSVPANDDDLVKVMNELHKNTEPFLDGIVKVIQDFDFS